MDYKKPQSTLVQGGAGIYPLTTADQVILADGSRLEKDGRISADSAANSAKLGGKAPEYYLQPRNLLDNSDFRNPVNQRGKSEYSNVAYTYTIDRWKTLDSGSVTVADGYIVTTKHLVQFMPKHLNGIYTAAAKMLDGTLLIASGAIDTLSIGDGNTIQAGNDGEMSYFALRKAGSFLWAALYEGSYTAETLPPYVPKGYAAELAECQRYFLALNGNNIGIAHPYVATDAYVTLYVPTRMRAIPTVDPTNLRISNHDYISDNNASIASVSNIKVYNTVVTFFANTPDTLSTGRLYGVSGRDDVYISADL